MNPSDVTPFQARVRGTFHWSHLVPGDALLLDCERGVAWVHRAGCGYLNFEHPKKPKQDKNGKPFEANDIPFLFALEQPADELETSFLDAYGYDLRQGGMMEWEELKEKIGLRELRNRRKFLAGSPVKKR